MPPSENILFSRFDAAFGAGAAPAVVSVPGRVNLIGEHVDYHNLPVLPMALNRRVGIAFRPRGDSRIRAVSSPEYGAREFGWEPQLHPGSPGDWANYIKAAAQAIRGRWNVCRGIDAAVVSSLPPAAGLSSSSALLTGFTLALLAANGVRAGFEELMEILPEGEYFVGTRGGGMDHAAVLACRAGCALLVRFAPVSVEPVPVPEGWVFLVAHSLVTAEKSGALRAEFNARRTAGTAALHTLDLPNFAAALDRPAVAAAQLRGRERDCYRHVVGEALRVREAMEAMRAGDAVRFGALLDASHQSLRDQLRVSCPALDELTAAARDSGALGARLTGAGFGGCAVVLCRAAEVEQVRAGLVRRYYAHRAGFDEQLHLITAIPSAGALFA